MAKPIITLRPSSSGPTLRRPAASLPPRRRSAAPPQDFPSACRSSGPISKTARQSPSPHFWNGHLAASCHLACEAISPRCNLSHFDIGARVPIFCLKHPRCRISIFRSGSFDLSSIAVSAARQVGVPMTDQADYTPPKVWTWSKANGGQFANINRPIAGPTHDQDLPVGKHPLQLYSLATPNGQKVTIMLEELLAAGHRGAEYDAWLIKIDGDQFSSGFVEVNPNSKIPALMDRSGPK